MAPNTESPRQQLLGSLQGCSLYIPDLQALLSHWPQYVHPELKRLQKDVLERLERCVMHFPSTLKGTYLIYYHEAYSPKVKGFAR